LPIWAGSTAIIGHWFFSNDKRSLGIYPRFGFIEYRFPGAQDYKNPEEVPGGAEALTLGTNYVRLLGLETSQLETNVQAVSAMGYKFKKNPFSIVTNRDSCTVTFGRSLDGVAFLSKTEGCRICFANHGVVKEIWLSWRNLQRYKEFPAATSETILAWIRQGKCVSRVYTDTLQSVEPSLLRRIAVNKVTPYYYGAGSDEVQDWVYPFLLVEAHVEATASQPNTRSNPNTTSLGVTIGSPPGQTNITAWIYCPIIDP